MEWIIVIAIRLLTPLTILRWPLLGTVLSIIADNFDVIILDSLGIKDFSTYNQIDKGLDVYFSFFQAYTLFSWKNIRARKIGFFLFAYRLIGTVLYEITNLRYLLLVFPNLFEFYYLFYLTYKKMFKKEPFFSIKKTTIFIGILLV